jgi:DNA-directed RNA polymerase specialized sigma24 family protein
MPESDAPPFDLAGCLDGVRRRDEASARALVDHLYPLVIRIVRSHRPRRVAEEDLAQEVFLKMFTRLDQYQGAVPFPHWVSRIAVTTCIDQLRAQKRRPELRWADLSEGEADLAEAVLTNENDVAVNDQVVIRLLDLEQKTIAEIAALTGWNQSLIKVRAFRARRKLRRLFLELQQEENS